LGPYKDLLRVTKWTLRFAEGASRLLERRTEPQAIRLAAKLRHFIGLGHRVVDQTERRVLHGESVPAQQKIVSLFEEHADIIRKGNRATQYGHKITLTVGISTMVLDCVIEDGNPADATLMERMLHRNEDIVGKMPRQVALDGGFASKANLAHAKALGVEDVCFSKHLGLDLLEMVRSSWVYKRLCRFRAGIEGCISFLKRSFGLDRCTWRSHGRFKSYVWASVVAFNLLVFARHLLER
jgi:IS5 family transposase